MIALTIFIFGFTVAELLTFVGVILAILSAIVLVNIKLAEHSVRIFHIELNLKNDEINTVETAKMLKESTVETARILKETTLESARILKETTLETAKILADQTEKKDEQLDKIDSKIDHVIDLMLNRE